MSFYISKIEFMTKAWGSLSAEKVGDGTGGHHPITGQRQQTTGKRGRVWCKQGRGGARNLGGGEMKSAGCVGLAGHGSLRSNPMLLQSHPGGPPHPPPRTWPCLRAVPRCLSGEDKADPHLLGDQGVHTRWGCRRAPGLRALRPNQRQPLKRGCSGPCEQG